MVAPAARATKNGSPSTALNERTGEDTPPGIAARARSKRSLTSLEPLGDLAREVGDHEVGAGALDRRQVLERDRVAVEPSVLGRSLDHRVLAAHVVRGDRHFDGVAQL